MKKVLVACFVFAFASVAFSATKVTDAGVKAFISSELEGTKAQISKETDPCYKERYQEIANYIESKQNEKGFITEIYNTAVRVCEKNVTNYTNPTGVKGAKIYEVAKTTCTTEKDKDPKASPHKVWFVGTPDCPTFIKG